MSESVFPPFPGEPTSVPARPEWSALESWVWQTIGRGLPADIDGHLDKVFDPKEPDDHLEDRRLSAAFLQTIALHEPYKSALPRHGIEIVGAWFDEAIDLRDGRMRGVFWLHRCRFEEAVGLNGLRCEGVISLDGSVFEETVDMRSLDVEGGLYFRNGARFKKVDLYGSHIGGNVNFSRALFTGRLILNAVKVGGNLFGKDSCFERDVGLKGAVVEGMLDLRRSQFKDRLDMWWLRTGQDLLMGGMDGTAVSDQRSSFFLLDCRNARIGGQLNLNNVDVSGDLNLSSIGITNEALLGYGSRFGNISLRLAQIGQHLTFATAKIDGRINLTAIEVGQDVFFRRASLEGAIDLVFAKLEGNLDFCGGSFGKVDLTGTTIAGELRLKNDTSPIEWQDNAKLILRNTKADALHDSPSAWPEDLELDGFVYHRFGGLDAEADDNLGNRRSPWFVDWLQKDEPHTPQPYRQCARVMDDMGHPEIADDVLYAGRERDRVEMVRNAHYMPALGLWFLKATIGYGHGAARYFRTLYWVLGLTLAGVLMLMGTGDYVLVNGQIGWSGASVDQKVLTLVQAASYSLDKLLPIMDLPTHHLNVILGDMSRLYFQGHKLMGYILALFLLAGITGLTK
ncbi:MAG: pentapeptide repeat-containing protein [Pseudomonadota bacterium]